MEMIRKIVRTASMPVSCVLASAHSRRAGAASSPVPARPLDRPPAARAAPARAAAAADAQLAKRGQGDRRRRRPRLHRSWQLEVQPIDLTTALQLADVQNPEFNVARTRILEAAALRQLAAAYFLPSINPGMNYDSHTGNLQQSDGNILSVNRSAFYVGRGCQRGRGGHGQHSRRVLQREYRGRDFRITWRARQTVRQREFESIAVRNQVFLQVTWAYSELLRAEGRRAAQLQARDEARMIAQLTADFSEDRAGPGGRRQSGRHPARPPRGRHPGRRGRDPRRLGQPLPALESRSVDSPASDRRRRGAPAARPRSDPGRRADRHWACCIGPSWPAQRAAIQAALMSLDGAKILPFSPTTLVGFSAGALAAAATWSGRSSAG